MGSGLKKSSTKISKKSSSKVGTKQSLNLSSTNVQGGLILVLLAVLGLALWFGYKHGCLRRLRRRRRHSCSYW